MRLLILEEDRHKVCAITDDTDNCPVLEFLRTVDRSTDAERIKYLFKIYAKNGRRGLTTEMFHEADNARDVWEFKKGRIRIYCFIHNNGLIIASHGIIKKKQTTDRRDVDKVVRLRELFLIAQQNNDVNYLTGGRI